MKYEKTLLEKIGYVLLATALLVALTTTSGITKADTTATSTATTTDSSITSSSTEPMISGVMASSTSDGTGATVTWNTDENSTSQVMYGTTTPYTLSSTLDGTQLMSHSVSLIGLTPSTTYHFQIISTDAASSTASSSDQTFMTNALSTGTTTATSTATTTGASTGSTTEPMISGIGMTGTASVTITWNTDENSTSQVLYGITVPYTASSTLDSTLVMNHSVLISGLSLGSTYHFQIVSKDGNGNVMSSGDQVFITGTSVAGTSTTGVTGPISLAPSSETITGGQSIDFNGRNFPPEQDVNVYRNGTWIEKVHADGGGNFTTGSVTMPNVPGTYTFTFVSTSPGVQMSSTITVQNQ